MPATGPARGAGARGRRVWLGLWRAALVLAGLVVASGLVTIRDIALPPGPARGSRRRPATPRPGARS